MGVEKICKDINATIWNSLYYVEKGMSFYTLPLNDYNTHFIGTVRRDDSNGSEILNIGWDDMEWMN